MAKSSLSSNIKDTSSDGFSLPIAVLAGFLLLLGSLALASRSGWGLFGSAFQNKSWAARSAAETGMNIIVSELNRPQNRWLNVVRKKNAVDQDPDYSKGESGDLWRNFNDSKAVLELRQNPCLVTQTPPPSSEKPDYSNLDPLNAESTTYGRWYVQEDGSIEAAKGDAKASFRLVRIERQPYAGAIGDKQRDINLDGKVDEKDRYLSVWRDRNQDPTGVGSVTIQVEGQAYQNEQVIASVILERTYELTPKCCGVPFGGKHGNIDYKVGAEGEPDGTTVCLSQLGLGLLGGAQGTDTGEITIRGRSTDVIDGEAEPVNPIYCLASNIESGCAITNNDPSINVAIVDTELPDPYTFCTPRQGPDSYSPDNPCPSPPTPQIINDTGVSCTVLTFKCREGKEVVINASANDFPENCRKTQDNQELHCNVEKIDSTVANFNFVTGGRKLFLYFPIAGPVINESGKAEFRNCQSFVNGSCIAATSTTSLSLFGSKTEPQTIRLRGTGAINTGFIYFPSGNVDLGGTPDFTGILWTNLLSSSGDVTWTIPQKGLTEVFALLGFRSNNEGEVEPFFYDFVLRSTNQQRWLGG